MLKFAIILIFASLILLVQQNTFANNEEPWNKTRAIKELPFCALILRNFFSEKEENREIYVLMEPDQVTENNLYLLFKTLSEKFPHPELLTVWVETDVEQLGLLATGKMTTSSPPELPIKSVDTLQGDKVVQQKSIEPQLGYYHRTREVELFRYNPNYPDQGIKTVILRGKE